MSNSERFPLLVPTSRKLSGSTIAAAEDSYLLLSIPQKERGINGTLKNVGNYAGVIVAVSGVVIILLLMVGISYHADVSLLVNTEAGSRSSLGQINGDEPLTQIINTPLGRLKGYIRKSRKGREFLAFYTVPYAKQPVGDLRFKDPQPVEMWDGVRDSSEAEARCIQIKHGEMVGTEDCLYSNIYVPFSRGQGISSKLYPTMVYIHGGGFDVGTGCKYGGEYFMDEDVILITFEYRLGLLGVLNTGDREATGNMMFKDQVMMLKWTKDYIKHFGGDPDRVTIFGNSAGGFGVGFLMISPMANGLFHGAISQSGTTLTESFLTIDPNPEVTKNAAASHFNCSIDQGSAVLLDCLRKVDAKDLVLLDSPDIMYGLTVEHGFDPNDLSNVFMPDKAYNLMKTGRVNRVPYMVGVTASEWIGVALSTLKDEEQLANLNTNFSHFAPDLLNMELTSEEADQLKTFYFGDKDIGMGMERNLTYLISDRWTVHGSKVAADLHSKFGQVYLFYLGKPARQSIIHGILEDFPNFDMSGVVSHADEVQFLFPYPDYPVYGVDDQEYFPFSEFMVKVWAQFASTGKPAVNPETEQWIPINPDKPDDVYWFELNDVVGFTPVLMERMKFWDDHFTHKQLNYDL